MSFRARQVTGSPRQASIDRSSATIRCGSTFAAICSFSTGVELPAAVGAFYFLVSGVWLIVSDLRRGARSAAA
jgi:hypothetical protein